MTEPPSRRSTPRWILLEGGGSRTWAGLATDTAIVATQTATSTNPRSVGDTQATDTLAELLTALLAAGEDQTPLDAGLAGVLAAHGAASTTATAERFTNLLHTVLARIGVTESPVQVINDIAPLLLRSPDGPVCVAIAGTGTGFAARHGSICARASGLEWLLSDEGGSHDLARAGLRAIVRALDHRGPPTMLTDAASTWCHTGTHDAHVRTNGPRSLPEALFDIAYAGDEAHKVHVATFAPYVLAAADSADPVAVRLVDNAVDELATGVLAVCRATGITAQTPTTLVVSGSMLTATATVREQLTARLSDALQLTKVAEHGPQDHADALLALRRAWWDDTEAIHAIAGAIPNWPPGSPARRPTRES